MKKTERLLKSVARSFSITLLALPEQKRQPVSITYLLARYADTLTDCGNWALSERMNHLAAWERAIGSGGTESWRFDANIGSFTPAEAELLLSGNEILSDFRELSKKDRENSIEVLATLIQAMKWDLKTFSGAAGPGPTYGVKDLHLFDWYCHSIAGCVGSYWVKTFELPASIEALATSYGKGLQRINILRDVPADWKRRRVYLPKSELQKFGLSQEGRAPWLEPQWDHFLDEYLQQTRKLLIYGANFCDSIRHRQMRLRWASAMPLVIGWETLSKLEETPYSDGPIKISRAQIRQIALSLGWKVFLGRKLTNDFQKSLTAEALQA